MNATKKHPIPASSRFLVWASLITILVFLAWANWAELDRITRASGQVIVSSRNQVIQAADNGVLDEILVKEGDAVKQGQILCRFEQANSKAALQDSEAKVAALKAIVARLHAEVYGGKPDFSAVGNFPEFRTSQMALFNRRQAAIREQVKALGKARALAKEELDMNLPLLQAGDVSRAEILRLERQVADLEGQITNVRNKYFQDCQTELSKAQEDLESASQLLVQRRQQYRYTEIRSPMDGIVRNVRLTTRGGVATPGQELMQIVPVEEELVVEAKVKPADIAFIRPGLDATVKLDAYDYSIYGVLKGKVSFVSPDTINDDTRSADMQPYYRVQVKTAEHTLSGHSNERIEIQPGMTATIEVKTGSRTVWSYLSKPITKTLDESLGER